MATHKEADTKHESGHRAHQAEHGKHETKAEGKKGVTQAEVGSGKDHDPNNFARDPERAAAAGRKGGQNSHKND